MPGGPLQKGVAAIGDGLVTGAMVGYFHAIEHPNGFNNLYYKISTKTKTNNTNINGVSKFMSDDDSEKWSDILAQLVKAFGMELKPSDLPFDVVSQHLAIIYLLFFFSFRYNSTYNCIYINCFNVLL